jgi:hypothetical protein
VMNKGLPMATFELFRSSLCVVPITHQTAGGVEYIYSAYMID